MMASALANALDIPLLRVQLHATISSHLGETAAQLGKIFDNIRGMRGVYLFDEFDALAAERGSANHDVGEMRRVCNSLLQFIELDDSESVIVAATNHHGILDRAMFRRFDEVVHFPMPSEAVAESLIRSRLIFNTGINWEAVRRVTDGIGHADLASACERVCKDAVLADRDHVDTSDLVAAIEARRVH